MKGFIEVDRVTHELTNNGFITRIKPGMLTYIGDIGSSFDLHLIDSIYTFAYNAAIWDEFENLLTWGGASLLGFAISPYLGLGILAPKAIYEAMFGWQMKVNARVIDRIGRLAGREAISIHPIWKDNLPLTIGLGE